MGDVLEVTGFYNSAPMAVRDFSKIYQIEIPNFCVYPDTDKIPAGYILLLEAPQSGRPDIPEQEAAQTMDQMLRRYNIDYDDCRRLKEIWPVRVHFLKNGTTNLHMSQYKPVRIIDTPEKKAFFFGQIL